MLYFRDLSPSSLDHTFHQAMSNAQYPVCFAKQAFVRTFGRSLPDTICVQGRLLGELQNTPFNTEHTRLSL